MDTQDGIFPITQSEAALLHDMGWSSGYGWDTEWDWWRSNLTGTIALASRDTDQNKFELVRYVTAIRRAREEADKIVLHHMAVNPTGNFVI